MRNARKSIARSLVLVVLTEMCNTGPLYSMLMDKVKNYIIRGILAKRYFMVGNRALAMNVDKNTKKN